jgi:DNA-binding response OmpR family regulator
MSGLQEVIEDRPDVVILDLGLPDIDGQELLKMLRAVSTVPVIVASARDDDLEIVRVLDAGADDYLVKPFSADQLEARIRAVLRRTAGHAGGAGDSPAADPALVVGGLRVDPARHEAFVDGERLELTPKEFELLHVLAANADHVVSKRQLLADIWQQPYGGADKTVDVHLSWLRRKLGESAASPRFLHTIRGVGVKLVSPATEESAGLEGGDRDTTDGPDATDGTAIPADQTGA